MADLSAGFISDVSGSCAQKTAKGHSHVIDQSYRSDVVFERLGDSLCMLGVLFRDHSQVADLISIVDLEVFERFSKVIRNFS